MRKVKIGELLTRIKECVNIENDKYYKRVTIRMYHKGVCLRDIEKGENIGTKNQFLVRQGQFIMSRIDAKSGAFGIIPNELDGAVVTNDFLTFEVNKDLIDIEYFELYSQTRAFIDFCSKGSTGTTNRKRLKEELFLNFEITIPEKSEQTEIVNKYKRFKIEYDEIQEELKHQLNLIGQLRQSILQEAVQGKLVPQDPNDEPASVLLEKIKEEKERLIKEGKIKKEKPLPPITEDEIPYELPKIWEWTRIGNLITLRGGKRIPKGYQLKVDPTEHIYIRITDMKEGTIVDTDLRYIDDYVYEQIKNYIITKQDLYITIAGTIGQVGIVPDKFHNMNLTENAARITPHLVDKIWLKYFLSSPIIQSMLLDKTNQMAQPKLALKRIQDTVIPLPPLNEQKRIVEKVGQLMALCDELEKNIEQSKKDSELLMQSVLQEAFKEA
jgi:type I restriction enzyme S subunit